MKKYPTKCRSGKTQQGVRKVYYTGTNPKYHFDKRKIRQRKKTY